MFRIEKLGDADILRKILSVLPHSKYASIITILHNMEDLSNMIPTLVIGKLVAFEMFARWVKKKTLHQAKALLSQVMSTRR